MTNWKKYSEFDGNPIYLNLDLAVRIVRHHEHGTHVAFVGTDGFVSATISEDIETVVSDASHGREALKTPASDERKR